MTKTEIAFNMVCDELHKYSDVPREFITMESSLTELGIDSLTLVEILFDIEDRLKLDMPNPSKPPATVAELVKLTIPFVEDLE